jgi:tRNA(Ile)-lysidine synthase
LTGQARAPAANVAGQAFEIAAFAGLPDEIRLRLLMRAINRFGTEGPVELGKAEALLARLDLSMDRTLAEAAGDGAAGQGSLKQTLAGALITAGKGWIRITPAPPRRARRG